MYVHSDDTSVNLSAYVRDYSWGAHKMYALYIVLNLECDISPGWLYQLGPEVAALGLSLEAPLVLVGISNLD
jgi:hypothetical protein